MEDPIKPTEVVEVTGDSRVAIIMDHRIAALLMGLVNFAVNDTHPQLTRIWNLLGEIRRVDALSADVSVTRESVKSGGGGRVGCFSVEHPLIGKGD
jgi:hypothetical protein